MILFHHRKHVFLLIEKNSNITIKNDISAR